MMTRRELRFETFDDAVRDAEHLLSVGYDRVGKWDLAQCCGHLQRWISYPMDGFPPTPLLFRPILFLMRNLVAPRELSKALESGTTKPGMPTIPQSVPHPGEDAAKAVQAFRETVARFKSHPGPFHPSPLFGSLDREKLTRLHVIHAAHHLSFLVPKTAGA